MLCSLTVRGEPVEPPVPHPAPFDRLRANGGVLSGQYDIGELNTFPITCWHKGAFSTILRD